MNTDSQYVLSKNLLRRMHGWARAVYPGDWPDRCAVVSEYLAQLSEDEANDLVRKDWPAVFAEAERNWPEAFAGWKQDTPDQG